MRYTTFLFFQVVVAFIVAIVIVNEPSLKKALIGEPGGLPDWLHLENLKVEFI